jgi:hypothetical protein
MARAIKKTGKRFARWFNTFRKKRYYDTLE